ncbi:MAG TPA: hypothetical protein VK179_06190 [Bacteroidales bacterium]|nr:hypothetical protein [Bacteroidales bacterium]
MKKLLLIGFVICLPFMAKAQDVTVGKTVTRENLTLRPNSRDYNIVNKGNNHQRVIILRSQAMIRNRQALMNRKMAMERRRLIIQQQLMRQQNVHQRMVQRRHRLR